jgi:hypothetical protein
MNPILIPLVAVSSAPLSVDSTALPVVSPDVFALLSEDVLFPHAPSVKTMARLSASAHNFFIFILPFECIFLLHFATYKEYQRILQNTTKKL